MQVHIDTLNIVDLYNATIAVTINGKTETVRCWNKDNRARDRGWYIEIYGIACKFRNGDKVWPAKITYWVEANKFTELQPTNYTRFNKHINCSLVGFESEFKDSKARSQHNGGYKI